ncbi:MAG TPA: TrmH family RNA methyltransferase, partial [Pseudomonadales bacterium]|nr:TrmH family RNA methyltransferase [Pseudomonadales bacterium]
MSKCAITDPLAPQLSNIRIVLINTQHPGNIGAAARAMKNMGLSQLYLVDPQDYPADKAIWRSGNATDILEQAIVVNTLDEAIADCGLVLGTSARERSIPWMLHTVREVTDAGSIAMVNGEVIDSVSLRNGSYPQTHGNRTGAEVEFQLRNGSRDRARAHISVSAVDASAVAEGPLG